MHREEPVSTTHQMYLKALYQLSQTRPVGRVRDLAKELDVTPSTVSAGLAKLKGLGLVEGERYGGVLLTPSGTAVARCVMRRFETLKALFVELLGVDERTAEIDACAMEHAASPETVNRAEMLLRHLRASNSIDQETLATLQRSVTSGCAECEAAGVCQAARAVATRRASAAG